MSNRRRALALSLAAAGASLALVPAAQARPYVTHYQGYPSNYTDDTLCSFPVQVNGTDNFTEQDFATRTVFVDQFSGTVSANGVTLQKYEDARIVEDYSTGNESWTGVEEGYKDENGNVIAQDSGPIVFDENGNTIYERGPHPIADGPGNAAVCAALSG